MYNNVILHSIALCAMLHPDVCVWAEPGAAGGWAEPLQPPGPQTLYNFLPGSSLGSITTEQCVEKIAAAINHAHWQTPAVVTGTGGVETVSAMQ